jgi:hypothetical protein
MTRHAGKTAAETVSTPCGLRHRPHRSLFDGLNAAVADWVSAIGGRVVFARLCHVDLTEGSGVTLRWFRGVGLAAVTVMAAIGFAGSALATVPPTPGMQVKDETWKCTAGFAAQGFDGSYYLFTSGHCDHPEGAQWTYEQGVPLGKITAREEEGDRKDAAIIRLDPGVGVPVGDVGGRPVRDVLGAPQIQAGTSFCKLGAITGETCGPIKDLDGDVVIASLHAKPGDSGSAGFVKNPDGTVSAVGVLSGSLDGDENTTVFVLVQPLLDRWGLRLLP